jgi:hypothetical protein
MEEKLPAFISVYMFTSKYEQFFRGSSIYSSNVRFEDLDGGTLPGRRRRRLVELRLE